MISEYGKSVGGVSGRSDGKRESGEGVGRNNLQQYWFFSTQISIRMFMNINKTTPFYWCMIPLHSISIVKISTYNTP